MAFEDLFLREAHEHRARRARRSGTRSDDGRNTENEGQPFDLRQHATIVDQTDVEFSVVRP